MYTCPRSIRMTCADVVVGTGVTSLSRTVSRKNNNDHNRVASTVGRKPTRSMILYDGGVAVVELVLRSLTQRPPQVFVVGTAGRSEDFPERGRG